jgi:DNA-directed RNA polymerase II subunit RPB2
MPAGINAIVAVCCYSGLNQEDSIIVNKGSVDRGMFHSTVYKTIACEERKKSLNSENIEIPSPDIRIKSYNYLKLDENGIIKEGAYVNKNDVLIGKTLTKTNKQDGVETKIECSLVAKQSEEGIVDKVFHLASQDGYRLIKVRIRQLRIPEIGDKLASTAAQKSTIGAVFNQEDMPFTRDGITPDLIINPMCLPGRMTINQLIECVIGKACSVAGKTADATPFTSVTNNPINQVKSELDKYGFNNLGNEVMMNGMTGEIMDAEIFIGPTYYQRLKHLVKDKLHSRARGSVQLLTNQPNSGRASEGGLNLWSSWKKFITKIQLVLCEGQHT